MLHEFLRQNRKGLIDRTRAKLTARTAPRATSDELENGVPLFLDELADRLEGIGNPPEGGVAADHGRDLLRLGFTVGQVVEDYGDICQAVTELAMEQGVTITTDEFHTLNKVLDASTAEAVVAYDRRRDEKETAAQTEQMGFFAHELRNLLSTASLAYEVMRRGEVGVAGRTGAVLGRSLAGMRQLVDRSLVEVRLTSGIQRNEPVEVATFVEDATIAAAITARERGIALTVASIDRSIVVKGDRQILSGILVNLLQNALKFTRPGGHVSLTTTLVSGRVKLAVADECGGSAAQLRSDAVQTLLAARRRSERPRARVVDRSARSRSARRRAASKRYARSRLRLHRRAARPPSRFLIARHVAEGLSVLQDRLAVIRPLEREVRLLRHVVEAGDEAHGGSDAGLTLDVERAAHESDKLRGDREPETRPAVFARRGVVPLTPCSTA